MRLSTAPQADNRARTFAAYSLSSSLRFGRSPSGRFRNWLARRQEKEVTRGLGWCPTFSHMMHWSFLAPRSVPAHRVACIPLGCSEWDGGTHDDRVHLEARVDAQERDSAVLREPWGGVRTPLDLLADSKAAVVKYLVA
jgi:hypothetical protein